MATETWTLYLDRTVVGTAGNVFPSTLTLTVDTDKDFLHNITVKEGGNPFSRSFTCTWQGTTKGLDLLLSADNGNNHYYKGRIHKRTIDRGSTASPITYKVLAGVLGHKPDAYPGDCVGNEDNVVIFTGTTP